MQTVKVSIAGEIPFTVNLKLPVPGVAYSGDMVGFTQVPLTITLPKTLDVTFIDGEDNMTAEQLLEQTLVRVGQIFINATTTLISTLVAEQHAALQSATLSGHKTTDFL